MIKPEDWNGPNLSPIVDSKITTSSFSKARRIRLSKQQDYQRSSISTEDYFPFGLLSYVQMIHIKSTRLRSLASSDSEIANESIEDTLLDMLNYVDFAHNFVAGDVND